MAAPEMIIKEEKTEKIMELVIEPSSSDALLIEPVDNDPTDDDEKQFIAKGIHNFSSRKPEFYDETRTKDMRNEIKASLKTMGCDGLIPGSLVDSMIDTATLPLGQKKGFWLNKLIKKTKGDTQKSLKALQTINMMLRNYGGAKRTAPVPSKNMVIPVKELLQKEPERVPEKKPEYKPEQKPEEVVPKPQKPKPAYVHSDSDSEYDEPTKQHNKQHNKHQKPKRKSRRYYESSSESSESSDDSEDDCQYYIKRFKKPTKTYQYRKPKRSRNFLVPPYIPVHNQLTPLPAAVAPPKQVPKERFDISVERPKPVYKQPGYYNFQQQQQPQQQHSNDYINHFLGNARH